MALSADQQAAIAATVAANADAYEKLENNLAATIRSILGKLRGKWYSDKDVKRVAQEGADFLQDAAQAVADMTESYLDQVLDVMDVKTKPVNLVVPDEGFRYDASYFDELFRPARDTRVFRLQGLDEFEAEEKALRIAEERARMDAALARRMAEREKYGVTEDVIGHRRILHPELSKGGPCGLCIVAATRTYSRGELRPLHNGCKCTDLPVTKAHDPGLVMNDDDLRTFLDRFYEEAGGTGRRGLQRVRVQILEHGELGPILVNARNRNRNQVQSKRLADQGLDPAEIFKVQDDLVKKYEKAIAEGKKDLQSLLDFHLKARDEWAKKLADAQREAA